jgi:hypothetical protein
MKVTSDVKLQGPVQTSAIRTFQNGDKENESLRTEGAGTFSETLTSSLPKWFHPQSSAKNVSPRLCSFRCMEDVVIEVSSLLVLRNRGRQSWTSLPLRQYSISRT